MFNWVPLTSIQPADEIRPVIKTLPLVGEPIRVYQYSRHLRPPAVEIRPLPAVEKPSLADKIFPESMPSAGGMQTLPSLEEPLVHQNPTPVTDEVISEEQKLMTQVDHHSQILPCSDVKPTPDTFDLTPQVVLMDIDIENEYVKYTGRTFTPGEMKTAQHKPLEDGMKPKTILCWMENDSEVQETVPPIQVDEVQDFTDEDENDSEEEEFDSRKETDDAPQKPRDRKIRLFHVNPSYQPQQLKKRNGRLVLLEWAEQKVREKEDRKTRKEMMLLERQLLRKRYRNDPKLKHLWINKHHRFNSSFRSFPV